MKLNQRGIPAVYMRGGTSKGLFFHARDLPPAGSQRDAVLLRAMGSPDPLQIDGMGGTYSSTSKVIVVDPVQDGVITYWFGQVDIHHPSIDWHGNCGNLTTAVGPFAVEEGLVKISEPMTSVSLHNGNTGTMIQAEVPVEHDTFQVAGDHVVAGVPGTGSAVTTRYLDPAGKTVGSLLPLGAVCEVQLPDGTSLLVSVVDAASVFAFIAASDLGVDLVGSEVPELNADTALLERIETIRSSLAVQLGRVQDPADAAVESATVPRIMVVAPGREGTDVVARAVMMGVFHRALPMTGALCLAAAAHTPGTIVANLLTEPAPRSVVIAHPKGTAEVEVVTQQAGSQTVIESLGVTRTARRIMDGTVYVDG